MLTVWKSDLNLETWKTGCANFFFSSTAPKASHQHAEKIGKRNDYAPFVPLGFSFDCECVFSLFRWSILCIDRCSKCSICAPPAHITSMRDATIRKVTIHIGLPRSGLAPIFGSSLIGIGIILVSVIAGIGGCRCRRFRAR